MQPFLGTPGRGRGRGRGSNHTGASNARGRGFTAAMPRGQSTPRAAFGQPTRGNSAGASRGISNANGFSKSASRGGRGAFASMPQTQGSWQQRFDKLEIHRKRERADAIANGIIADPDKPRALSQALTPTATCTDMCPEFERMQRGTQNDVWVEEKDMGQAGTSSKDAPAVEAKMVKKFRRAAAGIEEQLPSDLRTPHVLSQTCDYLFNDVVANAPELGRVHHFVWDRTRAIRNDFTILQVSSPDDLKYAVDCLERIARFHILSLHQMAGVKEKDFQYDWQQDREQLDRTLVSLMQYYDDSRGKLALPNEPEFRAYLIVFQLQDPDMEDRVQSWPQELVQHPRIRKAMKLYAAAGDTSSLQGPLRPPATLPIAQQDWQRFWSLVASKRTSYMTACVAEINFNLIRRVALQSLTRSVNQRATADFSSEELCEILAFNDESEAEDYLACYKVTFQDRDEGRFADISALKTRQVLPEPSPAPPKQLKSDMVEYKRFGRTLPAVISGYSVKEAQDNGMVNEDEMADMDAEMGNEDAQVGQVANGHEDEEPINDGESLFMPDTAKNKTQASPFGIDFDTPPTSMFGQPTEQPKPSPFSFGKPSSGILGSATTAFEGPSIPAKNPTAEKPSPFNFLSAGATAPASTSTSTSALAGSSSFGQPTSAAPAKSTFGGPKFGDDTKKDAPAAASSGFNFAPTANGIVNKAGPEGTSSLFSQIKPNTTSSLFSSPPPQPTTTTSPFGQPPKPIAPPKPFVEDGESSPDKSPTLGNFSSVFAPPAPSIEKPKSPAFSFTAPAARESEASKAPSASFAPFAKPEEGAKQPNAAPSFSPETSQATSLATATATFAPPSTPDSTSKGSHELNDRKASPRRSFGSEQFNRPARPSPLAQSYTAGTEAFGAVNPAPQPPSQTLAPSLLGNQNALSQNKPIERKPSAPEPSFATIIRDIAQTVTLTSDVGLFDQFLEFYVGKVITDVQETLHFERINARADEHRASVLSHRYGKLWRDICRRRRLARQGRERRKRTQQRLLESKSQASETASIAESGSVLGRSHRGSVMGAKLSRQEEVDKMFQQSISNGRWSRLAKQDEQTKGGSKRPTSSHSIDSLTGSRETGSKRLKSTSHVDDSGRISKPAPTSHPNNGALKRSSFREALPDNPPVASTTKSNYFRLKALGRAHVYDLAPTHPRKRQHAEVARSPAPSSRQQLAEASPPHRSSPPSSKLRRTSNSSAMSRHTAEETDAVIARARAAREALRDGAGLFDADKDTVDPLRLSTGSQVLYESPSLERARLDARWRASQSGTDLGSSRRSGVPAYRLRESRFVPREQYGKAIDRAREMRQSRSGNASRPTSRTDTYTPSKPAETTDSLIAHASFLDPSPAVDFTKPPSAAFGSVTHTQWPMAAPSQFSTGFTPFDDPTPESATMRSSTFGAFGGASQQSQMSGTEDHTFQPTQQSGFASQSFQLDHNSQDMQSFFGQPETARATMSYQTGFARDAPEEQSAVAALNDNTNNLDGSDDELQITSVSTPHVNGTSTGVTTNGIQSGILSDDEEDAGLQQPLGHANPYAALSNGFGDDEEEEDDDENSQDQTLGHTNSYAALADEDGDDSNDQYGQDHYATHQQGVYPGDPGSGEFDDEDGDVEDEDGEEFDEEESDFEDDEEDEDEEPDVDQYLDPSMLSQAPKPATNMGFATQATADSEVIELSD